ncbi:uncharacterized protein VTP21DRAFT_2781 [Calcarisporiella thermophila]|uniref:uncharacterized protein n=1 Tax=Calcarisporiella thermophila TaxID=911321 RepID=UPI00374333F7
MSLANFFNPSLITSGMGYHYHKFIRNLTDPRLDERTVVVGEIRALREKLSKPHISTSKQREYVICLLLCHFLGHDVSFGYIHAVTLTQNARTLAEKRVGYLACSLLLDPENELCLLLVNTFQRDIESDRDAEVCIALNALCYLMNPALVPVMFPHLEKKLHHRSMSVRQKSVRVLGIAYKMAPDAINNVELVAQRLLRSESVGVVSSALDLYFDILKRVPEKFPDACHILLQMLSTIVEGRVPEYYYYHGEPAPWMQIKCLRILAHLIQDDLRLSEDVAPVLLSVLRRAEEGVDAALAVVYECMRTVAVLHPLVRRGFVEEHRPFETAIRYLDSRNSNLRYIGLACLEHLDTEWWARGDDEKSEDLVRIMGECLSTEDESVRWKAMGLLPRWVREENVEKIAIAVLEALTVESRMPERHLKTILEIFKKYAPNRKWCIRTNIRIFELTKFQGDPEFIKSVAGDVVEELHLESDSQSPYDIDHLLPVLEHVSDESIDLDILDAAIWLLGEYGALARHHTDAELLQRLSQCITLSSNARIKSSVTEAVSKCAERLKNGGKKMNPTEKEEKHETPEEAREDSSSRTRERSWENSWSGLRFAQYETPTLPSSRLGREGQIRIYGMGSADEDADDHQPESGFASRGYISSPGPKYRQDRRSSYSQPPFGATYYPDSHRGGAANPAESMMSSLIALELGEATPLTSPTLNSPAPSMQRSPAFTAPLLTFTPNTMVTEEFGKLWVEFAHERQATLARGEVGEQRDTRSVTSNLEQGGWHIVEIIGNEIIASASIQAQGKIRPQAQKLVLVHLLLEKEVLEYTVRAQTPEVPLRAVSKELEKCLRDR